MRYFFIFLAFCFSLGCDHSDELGNDYYYLSDYEAGDAGYPYGSILYKSSEKNFFQNIIIYNRVIKVLSNNKYILVCQEPNELTMRKRNIDDVSFWRESSVYEKKTDTLISFPHGKESLFYLKNMNPDLIDNYVDSLFKNNPYYKKIFANKVNYWIIEKFTDRLIGPLSKLEFDAKRKSLGISDKLKFD